MERNEEISRGTGKRFCDLHVDSIRSLLVSLNAIKRTQLLTEYNTGVVVDVSQVKAVELDFFSTSNCFSSCFLHSPVGDPFYEQCNSFNNMDPLSDTDPDVIQTESPKNFVVIFEILPIDKE